MTLDLVLNRSPDAAYRVYDGQATIVLPSQAAVHVLNPIGSFIWESLDGRASLSQILERVLDEYDITRDAAETDLRQFVTALLDQGMVS
jgi:hypothetical protein